MTPIPDVTAVIPVYNGERFIGDAIRSVLQQTSATLEVIVVDDGSTDGTYEVVRAFGDTISCVRQANSGLAAARNRGVEEAHGEWVAFLDADDEWLPHKVAAQLPLAARRRLVYSDVLFWQEETGVTIGNYEAFDRFPKHRSKFDGAVLVDLLAQNFVHPSTVIVHKEDLRSVGGFDESLRVAEDWDLWLRLAEEAEFVRVDEPLVRVRRRVGSLQSDAGAMTRGGATVLMSATERLLASGDLDDRKRYALGLGFFTARATSEARRELTKALLRRPWQVGRWRWMLASVVRPLLARRKP